MDSIAPIAGISLEQYAELCAILAPHGQQAEPPADLLREKSVSIEGWTAARAGWTSRLEDPSTAATLAMTFVPAYHAALDRAHGPAPTLSLDAYIALSAEVEYHGWLATSRRLNLARHRFEQIAFSWDVAFSRDPQQYVSYVCLRRIEVLRLARGEAPRPIAALSEGSTTNAPVPSAHASAGHAAAAVAPVAIENPAPVAAAAVQPAAPKSLEQEASEAANAVGSALKSGFGKLGGALDAFGRSLNKPSIGSRVLVTWSDGNKYPGAVAEVGQGRYLVTMSDGRQVWIPEAYVSMNG